MPTGTLGRRTARTPQLLIFITLPGDTTDPRRVHRVERVIEVTEHRFDDAAEPADRMIRWISSSVFNVVNIAK